MPWLNGNLPEGLGNDAEGITRLVVPYLSPPGQRATEPGQIRLLIGGACHACSGGTMARLSIFPVGPFGSVSTSQTRRGYL